MNSSSSISCSENKKSHQVNSVASKSKVCKVRTKQTLEKISDSTTSVATSMTKKTKHTKYKNNTIDNVSSTVSSFQIFIDQPNTNSSSSNESLIESNAINLSKKINVSDYERNMNGAPASDIFDVKLLTDEELKPFESNIIVNEKIHHCCSLYEISTVWADKYVCIEDMRRIVLYHYQSLSLQQSLNILYKGIQEVESLRSSSARNALFLLNSVVNNMTDVLNHENSLSKLLSCLFGRIGSGPKFLCDTASSAVHNIVNRVKNVQLALDNILMYSDNKNTDVLACVYSASVSGLLRFNISDFTNTIQMKTIIQFMHKGLTSKSIQAKNNCRQAFLHIHSILSSNDEFNQFLESFLIPFQVQEILKSINSPSTVLKSVSSTSIKLNKIDNSKTRPSLKDRIQQFNVMKQSSIPPTNSIFLEENEVEI